MPYANTSKNQKRGKSKGNKPLTKEKEPIGSDNTNLVRTLQDKQTNKVKELVFISTQTTPFFITQLEEMFKRERYVMEKTNSTVAVEDRVDRIETAKTVSKKNRTLSDSSFNSDTTLHDADDDDDDNGSGILSNVSNLQSTNTRCLLHTNDLDTLTTNFKDITFGDSTLSNSESSTTKTIFNTHRSGNSPSKNKKLASFKKLATSIGYKKAKETGITHL